MTDERATLGGGCSDSPCLVCKLKALVKAQNVGDGWIDDAPFAINLLGVRLAHSMTDRFDDRMIAFFSLPAGDAAKILEDKTIEEGLVSGIADAAAKVNGAKPPAGRGVRRVHCSAVKLVEGAPPGPGDRVVAMFPATTDPGLVRTVKGAGGKEQLDQAILASTARLELLQKSKTLFDKELAPALKGTKDELAKIPGPKGKEAPSQAYKDAVKARTDAEAAIDQLGVAVNGQAKTAVTSAKLEELIKTEQRHKKDSESALEKWSSTALGDQAGTFEEFYKGAFSTDYGMAGDEHALFPLGHQARMFTFGLHHGTKASAAPALTIPEFLGERELTGKTLKARFATLKTWPRNDRATKARAALAALVKAFKAEVAGVKKDEKPGKKADDKTRHDIEAQNQKNQAEREALAANQTPQLEAATRAVHEAEREILVLNRVLKTTSATPPPAGAWIVLGCEVKAGKTTAQLADDDQFELKGHPGDLRTGREVRLHYHELAAKPAEGIEILTHKPAGEREVLPAKSMIVATEPMFESNGKLTPILDDDQLNVQAMIGFTNIHRGHNLDAKPGPGGVGVVPPPQYESLEKVKDWSVGCQVLAFFFDYNLLILMSALSKRWRCLHDGPPVVCSRIETGSQEAPDPFVWAAVQTGPPFPPKKLKTKIKDAKTTLQKDQKAAQAEVDKKVDAWFKAHKDIPRPKAAAEAEKRMVDWYTERVADFRAKLAAEKEANATVDKAGGPKTDAEKAARAKADAAWQEADQQRQALEKEQQDATEPIATRHDLDARIASLMDVEGKLELATAPFPEMETTVNALIALLGAAAAKAPPEAKEVAEDGATAAKEIRDGLKPDAWTRAVKMRHDWMRTCDLASPKCKTKFSYTLIELPAGDSAADLRGLAHLDQEFTRKAEGIDVNPKWSGFGAT